MKKNKPKIEVRDTKKYGKGVFAAEDISKGTVIFELSGERMDVKKLVKKVLVKPKKKVLIVKKSVKKKPAKKIIKTG